MEAKKTKKFERTTQDQLQYYVNTCKKHPELQDGRNKARATRQLWEDLAERLNAMRGPTRTAEKWKESLSQWKNQLRCRARKAKTQTSLTGDDSGTFSIKKEVLRTSRVLGVRSPQRKESSNDSDFEKGQESSHSTLMSPSLYSIPSSVIYSSNPPSPFSETVKDLSNPSSPAENALTSVAERLLLPSTIVPIESVITKTKQQTKVTLEKIYNMAMESIKASEEREERAIKQQAELTEALQQMSETFMAREERELELTKALQQISRSIVVMGQAMENINKNLKTIQRF